VLPRLNCVALESRPAKLDDDDLKWDHTRGEPAEPPHTKVEQACKEWGVMYKTKPASKCTKGGRGGQYYRYVRVTRTRAGTRRWLRKSLKLYLEKSRGWARDHRDCLVYRVTGRLDTTAAIEGLSTEELDTYELEWYKLLPEEEHIYDWNWIFRMKIWRNTRKRNLLRLWFTVWSSQTWSLREMPEPTTTVLMGIRRFFGVSKLMAPGNRIDGIELPLTDYLGKRSI
jgi:hypothetical protein